MNKNIDVVKKLSYLNIAPKKDIDASSKIKTIKPEQNNDSGEFVCQTCGKIYKKRSGNFTQSKSPLYAGSEGYMNTCRSCIDNLYNQFIDFFMGDEKKAIKRICQIFDLYYNEDVVEVSKNTEGKSRILFYIRKSQCYPHTGKTYSDTIIEGLDEPEQPVEEVEVHDENKIELMSESELKKAVSVWGSGFTSEQYISLNEQFDDWKSRVVIDEKTRETLVRELCIIKLQMNIALQSGNVELYTKLMSTYQNTMKSANLQPLQQDASDKAAEKPLGVMIQMFENDRPISEPREEWKDVDHIVRYITIYFLGHLCKMLKIKNRYSDLYEKEMAKYRVEIPELDEADDEDIFESIINGDIEDGTETKE